MTEQVQMEMEHEISQMVHVFDAEWSIKNACKPEMRTITEDEEHEYIWDKKTGPPPKKNIGNPLRFYDNLIT